MKVYLHWNDETVAEVCYDEASRSVSCRTYPLQSVEEALIAASDRYSTGELYGSAPPFGLMDKWREIALHYAPNHINPAAFYLNYMVAVAQEPPKVKSVVRKGSKVIVDEHQVMLPSLACSCFSKSLNKPCLHSVAAAQSIPHDEFVKLIEMSIAEPEKLEGGNEDEPKAISARFWDCSRLGCYLHHRRPRLEVVEEKVRAKIGFFPPFFNLDGATFLDDKILIVEWKVTREYFKQQVNLFKNLSRKDGVVVIVVHGDPMRMKVYGVQIFKAGAMSNWKEISSLDELVDLIVKELAQ